MQRRAFTGLWHPGAFLLITVAAALTVLPGGCSRKQVEAPAKYKIGAILPLTGEAATYGTSCREGMEVAASQLGVDLIVEDSAAEPKRAIAAFQKLHSVDHVRVVLGDMFSAPTLAFAPLAQARGVVVISPTSGAEAVPRTGSCIFSLYPTAQQEGRFMAEYLQRLSSQGGSVGVIASQEEVYRGLADGFSGALQDSPAWKVAFTALLAPDTRDFKNAVTKYIHGAETSALYMAGSKTFVANLVRQATQAGYVGTFLSQSTLFDPDLGKRFGSYLDGILFSGPYFDVHASTKPTKGFVASFQQKFRNQPDVWAAYGYDAVLVAHDALNRCPTCDGRRLAEDVAATLLDGTTGPIKFGPEGVAVRAFRVFTFKDGELVPAAPAWAVEH